MKKIILFILLLFTVHGHAQNGIEKYLAFETALENRIKTIIKPFDAKAQIFTKVKVKEVKTVLPGLSGDQDASFLLSGLEGSFSQDTIDAVEVAVISELDPFPVEILDRVKALLDQKQINLNVTVTKPSAQMALLLEQPTTVEKFFEAWNHSNYRFALIAGAIGLLGWLITATVWMIALFPAQMKKTAEKIESGLTSIGRAAENLALGSSSQIRDVSPEQPKQLSESRSTNSQDAYTVALRELPSEAILAVFTDAYWCEEDQYAAWMWANSASSQRCYLAEKWPILAEYLGTLDNVTPSVAAYHMHPCYLAPLELNHIDQSDLAKLIEHQPAAYKLLSPLRQEKLPVSLQNRLDWLTTATMDRKKFEIPNQASQARQLRQTPLGIQSISTEDENFIWENVDRIPQHLVSSIPSLVWFARLEVRDRSEILSRMSAQDIADAMIGTEPLLASVKECLPEKKSALVESYLTKTSPSRYSPGFQYIMKQALTKQPFIAEDDRAA
ncbi:MAG: hypothetical protein AABZ31_04445 [Bdellovibrionota bacterium]